MVRRGACWTAEICSNGFCCRLGHPGTVWRPWTGTRGTKKEPVEGEHLVYAFLTTEPNAEVAPVHEKAMPVLLLDREARETWLEGSVEESLALQGPAPDGTPKVVATGSREDASAA